MTTTESHTFSALLRRHRLAAGLTQETLAERAGLSVRGISDLERGINRAPYVATILRIGDALELSEAQRAELESCISRHRGPAWQQPVVQLPEQLTSLVGRERDVGTAVHLLRWEGRRLLTLTGPGGVGKTRLAIEVAAAIAADFEDGAVFVPLEEVVDAEGVRPAIAAAIHLREESGTPLHQSLLQYLKDRELLLVLDGFEHLMGAAALPAELLLACPRLKVLITSRAPLHLRGEQELDVKPLPVPDSDDLIDLERLERCPSVALNNLANIAKEQGEIVGSITLYEESLAIKRRLGDERGIAITLNNLGSMALVQGAYDRAAALGEEALTLLRALRVKDVTAAVDTVARAALHHEDTRRAAALYDEGLKVSYAAGDRELIAFCLEGAGRVAAAEGKMERAGTLYGAAEALRTAVGAPLAPSEVPEYEASLQAARLALGGEAFAHVWDRGIRMDLEAAVSFALAPARLV